jgi:hypothetical protein
VKICEKATNIANKKRKKAREEDDRSEEETTGARKTTSSRSIFIGFWDLHTSFICYSIRLW